MTTDTGQRIVTLDILRGVAVMGILLINSSAFALPDAAYFNPVAYGEGRPIDIAIWGANLILVDGKMRNLFALLFGASMLVVLVRAEAVGRSAASVHFARMGWLLVFGLAHFYLIWSGDILIQYAVIGMMAFALRGLTPRNLLRIGISLLAVQFAMTAGFAGLLFYLRDAASMPGADPDTIALLRRLGGGISEIDPAGIAREVARYRQDYAHIVEYRLNSLRLGPLYLLLYTGIETAAMVLLGMAGAKSGLLLGQWDRARYRRLAWRCYGIGLPIMLGLFGLCVASGFDMLVNFTVVTALSSVARPLLMLGHACLIILWATGPASALTVRVAAAGRAAFTNYLATSLVMTSIFYGYGLGLFGRVARPELLLLVIGIWALMLAWSKPWLDHFAYGPFEWAWRSLARWQLQPMRLG